MSVCPDQVCPQGKGTLKVGAATALVAGSSTPATTIPDPSTPSHCGRMSINLSGTVRSSK